MTAARQRLHDAALHLFAERGSSEVSVSELAQAAGIARGTVYNNIRSPDEFFDRVSEDLSAEMRDRMRASFEDQRDPAVRLAHGLRFFIRRAHREPGWGRFVVRFGTVNTHVRRLWTGPSRDDIRAGTRHERFRLDAMDEWAAVGLVNGTTIAGMWSVLEGHDAWRPLGTSMARVVLRGLGLADDEARVIAALPLPELAEVARGAPAPGTNHEPAPPTSNDQIQTQEPA